MDLITLSKLLLLSGCISHVTASPKVVSLPISRSARRAPVARRDAAAVTLQNRLQDNFYSVNVSVGTPAQQLTLDVDTGSSDIWFFNPTACEEAGCIAGTFDPTKSSSYELLLEGAFSIQYVDNSAAEGDYISDVIDLGNGLKVSNQTMALATSASDNKFGLFGIAFRNDEAGNADYPTIVDTMVSEGLIESRSYSLWLDDLESNSGTLLFGGYDPDQYLGQATVLDILPDFNSGDINSFTVDLSMMALSNGKGSSTILNQDQFPIPIILDSGTTLTTLPPDTFYQLAEYFGASYDQRGGGWVVSCDIAKWKGSIDYGFGGEAGTIIQVPFAELALDYGDNTGMCQFGLDIAIDTVLIGDTFLRSAYVIYNLDAKQVAIAQSAWNSATSNPVSIGSGDDLVQLIANSRDASNATVPDESYATLSYLLAETAAPELSGNPMTASVSGVQTSLSVVAVPTEAAASGGSGGSGSGSSPSSSSTGGGALQTAAMLLPMALPFAAAML